MKAIVYNPAKGIEIKETPRKAITESGEVIVKVEWAGICGSDIVAWQGGFERIKRPVILGHEFTGTVVETDSSIKELYMGKRVVVEPIVSCNSCELCKTGNYNICSNLKVIGLDADGGFASFVKVPVNRLHFIPDILSFEDAVLSEPVGVAMHMTKEAGLKYGDEVLILGAGPIGILVGLVAKESGAVKIGITDINKYRLNLARQFGLTAFDAGSGNLKKELSGFFAKRGPDISFELAADRSTLDTAINMTKIKGTILAGGIFKDYPSLNMKKVTLKELNILGSRMYNFLDFKKAIKFLTSTELNLKLLISEKLSIEEAIEKGFKRILAGDDIMKVILKP